MGISHDSFCAQLSDQDFQALNPETSDRVKLCEGMVADGRAEEIAFRCGMCAQACLPCGLQASRKCGVSAHILACERQSSASTCPRFDQVTSLCI